MRKYVLQFVISWSLQVSNPGEFDTPEIAGYIWGLGSFLEIFIITIYWQFRSSNNVGNRERGGVMTATERAKAGMRDARPSLVQHHSHTGKKDGQHDFANSKVPTSTPSYFHLILPHRVT
jgi:hypothetical protein